MAAGIVSIPASVTQKFFSGRSSAASRYLTETAVRKPFRLTVRERGTLDSLNSVLLSSKVEGTTTIISLVPEGTKVKEGDLLVELDASAQVETQKTQVIAVTQAEAALTKATEALAIQERQNESDIAAAKLALTLADLDLKKYIEGEYPQLEAEQEGLVQVARENLARAEEVYEFSQRLAQKGYTSQSQLKADRISLTKATIDLKAAEDKLRVLSEYTKERTIKELTERAAEARRAEERVKRQAEATLAQFKADVAAAQLTLQVEREKLARIEMQIANSKIYAPQAGEVVYAVEDGGRDQEDIIQLGASIRERKPIINLPDLTQMKVDARIHESLVSRVREGLPARVRVDAVPGKVFSGKVKSISSVPVNGDWMRPDLKEYSCIISLDYTPGEDVTLKPGLTAEVEIVVQERNNVLQVPFQSILTVGGERYTYVLTPEGAERRNLVTGAANDTHVEILDGVAEGEKVILNPRTHFADQIAELEGEARSAAEAAAVEGEGEGASPGAAGDPGAAPQGGGPGAGGPGPDAGGPRPGAARAGGPEAGPGAGSGGPGGAGRRDPAQFFASMDKNGDGGVTADEMPGQMASRFATMDANSDGKVDQAEFAEAAKNFRPPGGGAGGPGGPGGGGPGGRGPRGPR